ncbi:MAG: hypothetical protein KDM63_10385, partial [Verrucomicrobiae bacterium]|nr:hypothetical protein [Verrucomicrobiae bacterium]
MSNSEIEEIEAGSALENAAGVRFNREVQRIVRGAFSEAKQVSDFPRGITTPRLLLGLLYCGKNLPSESREVGLFAQLVGLEEISRLEQRYREFGQHEDSEARVLLNRRYRYSPESLELIQRAGKMIHPSSAAIEPHHLLLAMVKSPTPCCRWLMKDFPQVWEDTAVTVFGYPQASSIPDEPDFNEDSRLPVPKSEQSSGRNDWENHLERRFNAKFAPDGLDLIMAAAEQSQKKPTRGSKASEILNTRDFLPPMLRDSHLLKSLRLNSSMTVHTGGASPPWVEDLSWRDSNPDNQLPPGGIPFSHQVDEALKKAANLSALTPDYPSINKWHIAWAITSAPAPGITTSLADGGTDRDYAIKVLLANMEEHEPRFFESVSQALTNSNSYSTSFPPLAGTSISWGPESTSPPQVPENRIEPMGRFGPTTDWVPIEDKFRKFRFNERAIAFVEWLREQCLINGYPRSLTVDALYTSLLAWDHGDAVFGYFREHVTSQDQKSLVREFLTACIAVSVAEHYQGVLFVSDPASEVFETAQILADERSGGRIDPIDLMVALIAPRDDLPKPAWRIGHFLENENSLLRK